MADHNVRQTVNIKGINQNHSIHHFFSTILLQELRGLVKLKKIKKSEKTRISQTPPTPLSIFYIYFLNILKHKNNTKKHEKTQIFQKK